MMARVGFVLAVIAWSAIARADGELAGDIERARAEVARQKAELASDESLLGEAQSYRGKDRAQVLSVAQSAVDQQRTAVARAQARLDELMARECRGPSDAVKRTKEAVERQQKNIAMGLEQLDEWTRQSQEAQRDAISAGVDFVLGGAADALAERIKSARAFQGWLTRYDKQIRGGKSVQALMPKLERALTGWAGAQIDAKAGQTIKAAMLAKNTWSLLTSEVHAFVVHEAQYDAEIREVLSDPDYKKVFSEDEEGTKLYQTLFDLTLESKQVDRYVHKLMPYTSFASFLIKYGYNAEKYKLAYDGILKNNELTERQLKAAAALHCQMQRAVIQLHECRGTPAPALSPMCAAGSS